MGASIRRNKHFCWTEYVFLFGDFEVNVEIKYVKERVALTKFRMLLGNVNAAKADKLVPLYILQGRGLIGSGNRLRSVVIFWSKVMLLSLVFFILLI